MSLAAKFDRLQLDLDDLRTILEQSPVRNDFDASILALHGTRLTTLTTQLGVLNSTIQTEGSNSSRSTELRGILTTRVDQELQRLLNVRASIESHVAESLRIYNESIRVGLDQGT